MIQVTANLYVETGMLACNLGLVTTKEGLIMIDTPMRPTDAVKWREEVSRKGEVRYLINTEEHPDHWQGSHFFPGVIVTSQETREQLEKTPADKIVEGMKNIDAEGLSLADGYQVKLADITFTENLELHLGNHTIKLFPLPGHSPGGIGVYIPEERVVFTTDIVFHHLKSWLTGAVPSQWLDSLQKLKQLDVEFVVPGHGDICKKDYLDEQAHIIQGWVEVVKSAIKQGWSEEEAAVRISVPDPHPKQPGTPMAEEALNKAIIARLYNLYAK
ncbi:MBL fold metallo-hydrolase [Chloroflexota bacterium]